MFGLEKVSWFFLIVLIAMVRLVLNIEDIYSPPITDVLKSSISKSVCMEDFAQECDELVSNSILEDTSSPSKNIDFEKHSLEEPCSEYYVVREGETIYSIAEKCKDPNVWLWNPHVEDPDDVYPGVVIKLNV